MIGVIATHANISYRPDVSMYPSQTVSVKMTVLCSDCKHFYPIMIKLSRVAIRLPSFSMYSTHTFLWKFFQLHRVHEAIFPDEIVQIWRTNWLAHRDHIDSTCCECYKTTILFSPKTFTHFIDLLACHAYFTRLMRSCNVRCSYFNWH